MSEASPLVSHARGPGGVCMYVMDQQTSMDRHTIFAFWTGDPYQFLRESIEENSLATTKQERLARRRERERHARSQKQLKKGKLDLLDAEKEGVKVTKSEGSATISICLL